MTAARPLRVFLGAFGQPGHAFPMLALGAELAARGHEVTYETWGRWRSAVEGAGMRFVPAPEYPVFPTREQPLPRPLGPYEAVVRATRDTRPTLVAARPDVVVHDVLTLAPALAAELEGIPCATLIPHVYPVGQSGLPPYSLGARMPRTPAGARLWRAFDRPVGTALAHGREQLNGARDQLGLAPVVRLHGGLSERLTLVGTLPALEYPRHWPSHVHVVGPLIWEPPAEDVVPPPGSEPLVLVAPSTAQDPSGRLLRAAVAGLADEPVRLLGVLNGRPPAGLSRLGPRTRLVNWLSYGRAMPDCALVICHAGHGTLVRALACSCPVLAVPHVGDMAENAARLVWAGAGLRLPWPLLSPVTLRLMTGRALTRSRLARRAAQLGAWAAAHSGPARAADLLERLAGPGPWGAKGSLRARAEGPQGR
ncbi:MAG: glycosyltransferase [Solirubrobacteraceae bacterium]